MTGKYKCSVKAKERGRPGYSFYHHTDATLIGASMWFGRTERAVTAGGGRVIVMSIEPVAAVA